LLRARVIPVLLLKDESLVKTVQYGKYGYIGDPINTCRIFNELEVDELSFLDISASKEKKDPDYKILQEISNECFMPLSYGGGIDSFTKAEKVFKIGFEKIILNTASFTHPEIITEIARVYGNQAVVIAVDVRKSFWGKYEVFGVSGTVNHKKNPVDWVKEMEDRGAGEILLTSIDREGTWKGLDLDLIKKITDITSLPVIAHGGAGNVQHIAEAVKTAHASAVALGSMVVYQKQGLGVLVSFPDKQVLEELIH
jgi:imidazole glycerol-phosphate synthase subunit HisF